MTNLSFLGPIEQHPIGACAYCGHAEGETFHFHFEDGSPPVRLWCSDIAACTRRQNAEAERMASVLEVPAFQRRTFVPR